MFELLSNPASNRYPIAGNPLKEAYSKLNREEELVSTSKRIAQAYLAPGQLSSAILEYEVLQRHGR